ncbi:hypothetical protein A1F96_08969 [Pyrenophora tritici-repentis]|uniref:Uncharacterized protein n=1 Tax=Pyrenophora tritici-repentis TaxID=45151 RepID=A0A2W1FUK4_9PLEO|nr:hypothetical protein PtrM4_105310 [Pyrenophora tritici-repentis]KAI0571340.1 hypothetical protein Alg215_10465 [Pyrenophora tritici-repentis]KAI1527430.1 hypothetical protein PtrSN001C_009857 [Pyrenophora tritici-repentis]KAI1597750.1 hypothetical protein PtrCC142_008668 [Pyrenophora tritici-repentis]PZD24851.1 hypothetical protein A1F96_08969 [Pyrenophora tritici-repentis]
MPSHIYLPSHPKLDERVAEVILGDHTALNTTNFAVLRYKEHETHGAVTKEILQSRLNDISNAVGKQFSRPSMQPEIMRNISGCITTKPDEIFAIVPVISDPKALQQPTIYIWENKTKKIERQLEKGIHLVLANVSFSVSEFVDFYVLPFKYEH